MDASPNCINLIHRSEGKKTLLPDGRYKSYLDTLPTKPVWTIWAGLTKGVGPNTCWSVEECEAQFRKELNVYEDAVERFTTVPLNQNQFDALVSLVYNIGPGSPNAKRKEDKKGYYWSTLRKLLNEGKYEQAAGQFKRYNRSGGVVYNGLIKRRAAEAALFMKPVEDLPDPLPVVAKPGADPVVDLDVAIPQSVDAPKAAITEGAAKSPTIWSSIVGLFSTAAGALWQLGGTVATETTQEVGAAKTALSGFEALWSHLGVSLPTVLALVTIGALGVVLARHVQRYAEGRA